MNVGGTKFDRQGNVWTHKNGAYTLSVEKTGDKVCWRAVRNKSDLYTVTLQNPPRTHYAHVREAAKDMLFVAHQEFPHWDWK